MSELKFEAGSHYKLRNGVKAVVYRIDAKGYYPIRGYYDDSHGVQCNVAWSSSGYNESAFIVSIRDIIAEWTEPHPTKSWLVDVKILVRNKEKDKWVKRYFSHFSVGSVYAFANGSTSYSSEGGVRAWKFAKLFDEDEK